MHLASKGSPAKPNTLVMSYLVTGYFDSLFHSVFLATGVYNFKDTKFEIINKSSRMATKISIK